ncbi:hypothetical protein [Malacoplasma iowae]|uniref:Uncharacterized protein n=2 Tax=Malacoplasma iowae TaxID=2116 RepID=A0A084U3S9_MALIO|nr:hypothetical protein [Malacoplasma iowae]VEU63130.1 Uncharacterised protein [Mycoplasmopsis fermentans]EGZ31706.1 hypothetical protein GUU_00762 [Malacoplasma iowae 695]KFB07615.1 hypothetical protein P271_463 [Malacoplasma iowae DK-CPA]QHG89542.1 hypothetical protein EER00_01335 [Malacoplasma iowae 695]WPL35681.1 hypothetical protein QX180_05145 [Malacoplasma iowae]
MDNKKNLNNLSSQINKANVGISYKKPKNIKNKQFIVLTVSGLFMCGTIIGAGFAINEAIKVINKKSSKNQVKENIESKEVFKLFLKTTTLL